MNFSEELAMAGELELTDSELEMVNGGHRWPPPWWWYRRPEYDDYYPPYWDGGYSPFNYGFGFEGGGDRFRGEGGGYHFHNEEHGEPAGEVATTADPT